MNINDLTGKNASSTYGRLLQTVDGFVYDGLGNTFSIPGGGGTSGSSGSSGIDGSNGSSGSSGIDGSSGSSGSSGTSGSSGSSGIDGSSGSSGSSGTSGSSGSSGIDGSSGSSGTSGSSGSSGTSGVDGNFYGSSGTSGVDGDNGTSGTSPFSDVSLTNTYLPLAKDNTIKDSKLREIDNKFITSNSIEADVIYNSFTYSTINYNLDDTVDTVTTIGLSGSKISTMYYTDGVLTQVVNVYNGRTETIDISYNINGTILSTNKIIT